VAAMDEIGDNAMIMDGKSLDNPTTDISCKRPLYMELLALPVPLCENGPVHTQDIIVVNCNVLPNI